MRQFFQWSCQLITAKKGKILLGLGKTEDNDPDRALNPDPVVDWNQFKEAQKIMKKNSRLLAVMATNARQHGINPILINWILHMLKWQRIHILVDWKSMKGRCLRGWLPKEIFFPLLWLLGMDTLLWLLEDTKSFAHAFVDNLVWKIVGRTLLPLQCNSADNLQLVQP